MCSLYIHITLPKQTSLISKVDHKAHNAGADPLCQCLMALYDSTTLQEYLWFIKDLGLIFIISISYDNIVLNKVVAET